MNLQEQWQKTWKLLDASGDGGTMFRQLMDKYAEAHRRYHTVLHLAECFEHLNMLSEIEYSPGDVQAAIWFHDAVYDPRRPDNEEMSAKWCASILSLAGVRADPVRRIVALILSTCHGDRPEGIDAEVLADVDLSILGAPRARFMEYEQQVREEYGFVPEDAFRTGRAAILERFLRRPSIYHTLPMRIRFEERARENIRFSLERLRARAVPLP